MVIIETERFLLRHFHMFDAQAMEAVFGDAEVMRLGDGVQTKQWVRDWLRGCLDKYEQWGFGPWAVGGKATAK